MQKRVVDAVRGLAPTTALVPDARGLDADGRIEALAAIGATLCSALESGLA
jgi:hypothetical protein